MIIIGIIIGAIAILTAWHRVSSLTERKSLFSVGEMVCVDGKNMRVYRTGTGEQTIVMMTGMGTFSPIIDFMPLAEQLSENYQVVIIEPLGYGQSDDTDSPRTNENMVSDIRNVLKKMEIEPPYILMPHSISGIYALEYVQEYPEEIQAIVGIDTSVPKQAMLEENQALAENLYTMNKVQDVTGITRLALNLGLEYLDDMKASGMYNDEQLKMVKAICAKRSLSKAQLSENNCLQENFEKLYSAKLPEDLPVLFFISKDSCKSYEENEMEFTWDGMHEDLITNPGIQQLSYLEGSHYLHWTNCEEMANQTKQFLANN